MSTRCGFGSSAIDNAKHKRRANHKKFDGIRLLGTKLMLSVKPEATKGLQNARALVMKALYVAHNCVLTSLITSYTLAIAKQRQIGVNRLLTKHILHL